LAPGRAALPHSTARRASLLNGKISFLWKSYKKRGEFFELAHPNVNTSMALFML